MTQLVALQTENDPERAGFAWITFAKKEFPSLAEAKILRSELNDFLRFPVVIVDFSDVRVADKNLIVSLLGFCREMIHRNSEVLVCNLSFDIKETFQFASVDRPKRRGRPYFRGCRTQDDAMEAAREVLNRRIAMSTASV